MASGHRSPTRHETVDDHDERDHQEKVDYSTNVYHEGTEEPKDEQDDGDRPEHACPLSENCLPSAAMTRRATGMPHPGSSAPEQLRLRGPAVRLCRIGDLAVLD